MIAQTVGGFTVMKALLYTSLSHLNAHVGHLYNTYVFSAQSQRELEAAYLLSLANEFPHIMPPLIVDFFSMSLDPHAFGCDKFAAGSKPCDCVYSLTGFATSSLQSSLVPKGKQFEIEAWDFEVPTKSGGFGPLHTCVEAMGPLFREGTGKQFTYCKICGKWLREWKT